MKSKLFILLFLLLSGCSKFGFMSVQEVQAPATQVQFQKTLAGQLIPVKLETVSDEAGIAAQVCTGMTVYFKAKNGLASGPLQDTKVLVSSDNDGKFYSDDACTKVVSELDFPKGLASRRVFFKSGVLRSAGSSDGLRITVSSPYFSNKAAGFSTSLNIINSKPIVEDKAVTIDEDSSLTSQLDGVDANGDALTFIPKLPFPSHSSSFSLSNTGALSYQPTGNFNGTDTVYYAVSDGRTESDIKSVTITVNPVNDNPAFLPLSLNNIPERQNDGDPGSQINLANFVQDIDTNIALNLNYIEVLTYSLDPSISPQFGTVSINGSVVTYTANKYSNKNDSFKVKVTDKAGAIATAVVSVSVTPFNNTPQASNLPLDQFSETNASITRTFDMTQYVSDIDSDPALNTNPQAFPNIQILNPAPSRGVATYNAATKRITYIANADYSGHDTIRYRAVDTNDVSRYTDAIIPINILPTADFPHAPDVSGLNTQEETALSLPLGTDVDMDATKNENPSGTLSVQITVPPSKGTYDVNTKTYTPALNKTGMDSFRYRVQDSTGNVSSEEGTVSINIFNVNDAPVANNGSNSTQEDTSVDGFLTATDIENDTISYQFIFGSNINGGVAWNSSTGAYTFYPAPNFYGTASFRFKACDYSLCSQEKTITITVSPVNDAPTAAILPVFEILNTQPSLNINIAATDVEGDTLSYSLQTFPNPLNGMYNLTGNIFTYTPNAGSTGLQTFGYRITDTGTPQGITDSTFTIDVGDGSLQSVYSQTHLYNQSYKVIGSNDLKARVWGVPAASITYTVLSTPQHGYISRFGAPLNVNSTFTRADIESGAITYTQQQPVDDSFTYGASNVTAGTLSPLTFTIYKQ